MAFSLGGFLQRILFPAFGLATIPGQQRQQNRYQADADRQIANSLRVAGQSGPQTLRAYDDSNRRMMSELMNLRPRQMQSQDIVGGYQDRYNTARRDLADYGRQQSADINEYFDNAQAEESARRQERGIGSTTAMNSLSNLTTTKRSAEQRRLGEDLTRMRQTILNALSGDTLGARQMAMGTDALQTGNIANAYGSNAANRSNIVNQGYQNYLNTLMGINLVPPQQNPYPGMAGQSAVAPVNYSQNSSAPWLQAGGAVGGAAIGAKVVMMFCIDGSATLEMTEGTTTLAEVEVGDSVMCDDYSFHEVIGKDYGTPHKSRRGDFVKITKNGYDLICTNDHVVNGIAAKDWDECVPCEPVPCGDLRFKENVKYIVNRVFNVTPGMKP